MQDDKITHHFAGESYFEDVIELYNFDRRFRLIMFNAIERIEIALRTKMIYHLSLGYGSEWYLNSSLFPNKKYFSDFEGKIHTELTESSEEFNQVPLYKMGFPKGWSNQPIWKNEQ